MKGTAWRLYLGTGALATGAYYLLPERAGAVLNVVVGASAAAAIAAEVRWHRPARRLAWWLIAAAQSLFVIGDALFSVNELVLNVQPFPSLADALYLPGDDGVGFEPVAGTTLVRQGHFGLVAMQERVEMAGGHFQLDTRPGAGVVLRAMFRVPPAA